MYRIILSQDKKRAVIYFSTHTIELNADTSVLYILDVLGFIKISAELTEEKQHA